MNNVWCAECATKNDCSQSLGLRTSTGQGMAGDIKQRRKHCWPNIQKNSLASEEALDGSLMKLEGVLFV